MNGRFRAAAAKCRGVALLLVMIVLLLIATLATEIALTARTHFDLADHSMNDFLLRSVVEGRREILVKALEYDLALGDNIDTEADEWSWKNHSKISGWGEQLPDSDAGGTVGNAEGKSIKYRNRDVHVEAWCEDERGKLNLRLLLRPKDDPLHLAAREALVRLIDLYREKWNALDVSDSDANSMVEELIEWLNEKSDTEDNPAPAAKKGRGRLLTIDDLLRVPGGHWTLERLYDVRDPDQGDLSGYGRTVDVSTDDASQDVESDSTWERQNGVPGLGRYLSVWTERGDDPEIKVNVNTASPMLMRALFDAGDEELADAIVSKRREGGTPGETTTTSGSSSDTASTGWFKNVEDLKKVEGIGTDLAKDHPRLERLAAYKSSVFSVRIVASVLSATKEGDDETGSREIRASLQFREVVQRTTGGFVSLYAERRRDPILEKSE